MFRDVYDEIVEPERIAWHAHWRLHGKNPMLKLGTTLFCHRMQWNPATPSPRRRKYHLRRRRAGMFINQQLPAWRWLDLNPRIRLSCARFEPRRFGANPPTFAATNRTWASIGFGATQLLRWVGPIP